MKDYKLQEEQLLVSFRPDLQNNQPPTQNMQDNLLNKNTNLVQNTQVFAQTQPLPNMAVMQPQQQIYYSQMPPPQQQRISQQLIRQNGQQEIQRSNSPPIVFNYTQNGGAIRSNSISQQNGLVQTQGTWNAQQYTNQVVNGPQRTIVNAQVMQPQQILVQKQVPQQVQQVQQQVIVQQIQQNQQSQPNPQQVVAQQQIVQPNPQPQQQIPQQPLQVQQVQQPQQVIQQTSPQQIPPQNIQVAPQSNLQIIPQPNIAPPQYLQHQQIPYHPQGYHPMQPLPHPQYMHQPIQPQQAYPHYNVIPPAPRGPSPSQHQQQYPPQGYPPQPREQYPPEGYYHPGYYQNPNEVHYEGYPYQQEQYPPQYQQYPPEYYTQQGEYPPEYFDPNQQGANEASSLWQQRFFFLYEKYAMFYQKYEGITKQTGYLADQFLHVDNEDEWLALKQKYDLLVERMNEMRDEYALILQQMQQNIQQNQKIENSNSIKEEAGRVWEHRYHELLEQYESLSHHYAQLQSSSMAHNDMDENERVAMMNQKYARLEAQYNHVVQQLQNSPNSMQSRQEHEDLLKYTQQLQGYIEQLQGENNTLMKGMKTSVQGSKMLDQGELNQKLADKQGEVKNLTHMIVTLEEKLKQANESRPKSNISKEVHTSQLENQIHQMTQYCTQLQQKLSMKEYQTNGLKDKVAYLEEQIHQKNQDIANNTKFLQDKLLKIQSEISLKNTVAPTIIQQQSSTFNLADDYQNRIKDYQKTIVSKNNQIRILEERVIECESETRKLNFQKSGFMREWQDKVSDVEEQYRKKINDKDSKIRTLQFSVAQLDHQNQKRAQEKDNAIRTMQGEIAKISQQIQGRLLEKDILIKSLRDTASRMDNQLKERNNQISRIRSPNVRSPNQSFIIENVRHDDELRLFSEQVERKTDEINKLKKERDAKNKQFKDLQGQYQVLQQENNKRRIQINNLKRQISTISNFQYQIENLKTTIAKRIQENNQLKNQVFEKDKLKMELDSKTRDIEKLNQISKYKNKEIQTLTQRNYELQEKIRQKDFKFSTPATDFPVYKNNNNFQELMSLQEDVRKKQIELSRLKMQNDELSRSLKRQSDELTSLKQKYPSKLKQTEDQLNELKIKFTITDKKFNIADVKCRQLQQMNKKIRATSAQQLSSESIKLKQYYTRFIDRQEEEIKLIKQKVRKYELQLHDCEIQIQNLNNRSKENQISKNQLNRRVKNLMDKIEEKEEELRAIRGKQNGQINQLKKKEARFIELQAQVKSKQYQIKELQKKLDSIKSQNKVIKKEYDDYKHSVIQKMEVSTHKQMQTLNKQITDYQSRMVFQNHNFDFKTKDKKSNQVFERRVIYELKAENEMLRRQLDGRGINISLQKLKINQMQQEALMKSKHMVKKQEHSYSQQINFYKQKNKELEERVNSHIAVNKNLRERLQSLLQQNTKYEQLDKLKMRVIELEKREAEYQQRISRLQEENKIVKKDYNSLNASSSISQQYQLQIQQSNRKISQIVYQKNSLQQELTIIRVQRDNLDHKCDDLEKQLTKKTNQNMILQSEIQRLQEQSNSQRINKPSNEEAELRRKIDELNWQLSSRDVAINNQSQKLQHVSQQYQSLQEYVQKLQIQVNELRIRVQSVNGNSEQILRLNKIIEQTQNSIDLMRQRIDQLQGECQYYKTQSASSNIKGECFYYLQLIRNNCVQLQALASEVGLESNRLVLLAQRITQNSHRGLQSCQYLHQILNG